MLKTIQKIIELSDCEWIQQRWIPKIGDYAMQDEYIYIVVNIDRKLGNMKKLIVHSDCGKKNETWLPVGFNPETCNLQIDDLLMEILNYKSHHYLRREFSFWLMGNERTKVHFRNQSDIVLKLIWLRELIEKGN